MKPSVVAIILFRTANFTSKHTLVGVDAVCTKVTFQKGQSYLSQRKAAQ